MTEYDEKQKMNGFWRVLNTFEGRDRQAAI